jgi:hypothetical protein
MKFENLIQILGDEPVFESSLLLAGNVNPAEIRKQLSRWAKNGRIYLLRRGLYVLASPYRKKYPHPFSVANKMVKSSYVSCQSALSYYGMIPEYTPAVTSVTVRRPGIWSTELGRFEFRHIKSSFFHDYDLKEVGEDQTAFIATPEKSLLDLIYLVPESHTRHYLTELRLHFPETFNLQFFQKLADHMKSPKLTKAAANIRRIYEEEHGGHETL